ncbi:unnamed protein product, partial [Symbiodinium microadriaticum]
MSKTPFSADYIHKLLRTIPESEREKFLVMLATQPILEQQPASGSSGAPASDPPPQPTASTPQTLDEFCDTVAQEAYTQPTSPAAPPPKKATPAAAPPRDPAATAAKPAGSASPPKSQPKEKVLPVNPNVHPLLLRRRSQTAATAFTLCTAVGTAKELKVSMAAEFFALMTESSIPDNIREALASYDTPLFARSCNDQEELASLISHLMEDDSLLIRPKKLPRLTELSDLLLDEAPSRDIHDGPASFNLINQLLTLATNSIALCRGAHLGSLKLYQKKFLKLCFHEVRVCFQPSRPHFLDLEAQAADKRAWELIGELVNVHAWKLDDALHEVTQVRADLSTLRAQIPKHLFQLKEPWRNRQDGKGNRPHFRGKWLSTLFMEGKQRTLCMRYQ